MTLTKTFRLLAVACLVVGASARDAAAQAPALNVTANGSVVTIQWTPVQGALGYNLQVGFSAGGTEVASVNLPSTITNIVVAAPAGTYFLRVRGLAGATFGPFSNEASTTVGGSSPTPTPGPCVAPTAPTVTTTVSGPTVTVNWSAVAGAAGYRVEFSRTPNATELVQNIGAGTTSYTHYVGMVGTFFVRVVSGNTCGTATSDTQPFTISTLIGGSGPRTPDPAPGQRLPLPGYGEAVVEAVALQYPGDLRNSCTEHHGTNVFMFRVLQALRARDSRWGLNWKRGNRGDLSQDIVTYHFGSGPDEDTTNVYIIDIIGGHCGSRPTPAWIDQTEPTRSAGTIGRWTLQPYLRAGFAADTRY